jgi:hypothetical protein
VRAVWRSRSGGARTEAFRPDDAWTALLIGARARERGSQAGSGAVRGARYSQSPDRRARRAIEEADKWDPAADILRIKNTSETKIA